MLREIEFIADRDMADSIKLEASVLHPRAEQNIKFGTKKIRDAFVDTYKPFIPEETLHATREIEDRVLVMEPAVFKNKLKSWCQLPNDASERSSGGYLAGVNFHEGKIMAFNNPFGYLDQFSKELKREIIKECVVKKKPAIKHQMHSLVI
jgi:hypothetical protein